MHRLTPHAEIDSSSLDCTNLQTCREATDGLEIHEEVAWRRYVVASRHCAKNTARLLLFFGEKIKLRSGPSKTNKNFRTSGQACTETSSFPMRDEVGLFSRLPAVLLASVFTFLSAPDHGSLRRCSQDLWSLSKRPESSVFEVVFRSGCGIRKRQEVRRRNGLQIQGSQIHWLSFPAVLPRALDVRRIWTPQEKQLIEERHAARCERVRSHFLLEPFLLSRMSRLTSLDMTLAFLDRPEPFCFPPSLQHLTLSDVGWARHLAFFRLWTHPLPNLISFTFTTSQSALCVSPFQLWQASVAWPALRRFSTHGLIFFPLVFASTKPPGRAVIHTHSDFCFCSWPKLCHLKLTSQSDDPAVLQLLDDICHSCAQKAHQKSI